MNNQNLTVSQSGQTPARVPYEPVCFSEMFCGVCEDEESYGSKKLLCEEDELYTEQGELYEDMLEHLCKEFLKDKYSLCLQIRDGDRVVYEFPKIPCPGLFLEQLRIRKI